MMKMHKLALLLALLAAALAVSCSDAAGGAIRAQLTRPDAGRGLTRRQLLRRMARPNKACAAQLLSATPAAAGSGRGRGHRRPRRRSPAKIKGRVQREQQEDEDHEPVRLVE